MPEGSSPASNGLAAPDDETLVNHARQGSRSACEALFQRHRGVAYRVAYRLLGNEQDALDAVQDGLLKAFSGLENFDGRSGFRTWLMTIVTNAALDVGRKRSRRAAFSIATGRDADAPRGEGHRLDREPSYEVDPALGLHRDDLRRVLDAALARLSPKLRVTFVLFAEAGLSYKEIAESQNVPIGTVMSRLHEARQKLQAIPEIQKIEPREARESG